jgi:hypothetical protein
MSRCCVCTLHQFLYLRHHDSGKKLEIHCTAQIHDQNFTNQTFSTFIVSWLTTDCQPQIHRWHLTDITQFSLNVMSS